MATAYSKLLDEEEWKNQTGGGSPDQVQNAYQKLVAEELAARKQATQPISKQTGAVQSEPTFMKATSPGAVGTSDTNYNTGKTVISPENYQIYRAYRRKDDSFTGNMGAADRAAWNAIGAKYAAGDQSWLTDTNDFREDGNWSSYYDENGNINGWLYAANGVGNYAPVFGGKVGETGYKPGTVFYGPDDTAYILDRDGSLVRSGDVVWAKYGEYFGPTGGYHQEGTSFYSPDANGKIQKYDYATAPDDILEANGYYRTSSGALMPITDEYRRAQAMKSGELTPEQAAVTMYNRYGSSGGSTPGGGNIYSNYLSNYNYNGGNYGNYAPSDYKSRRDAATSRAENMEWNYDPNTDPVWQAYQKQYRREGDRATNEAMAQAAAMTGGIPSSYAATAASQAGDYYAAQLSDRLPQVYQDSYNRYLNEFQRQLQLADQWAGYDDREYSRDYQARRDAINDARYDQEWAQKLREYADEQGWKRTEWEQYLREYGDQLSEKERQWAYQMARDAVSDDRYAQDWAQKLREYDDEQSWKSTEWGQKLREYDDEQAQLGLENDWAQTKFNIAMQEYDDGRYYDALDIFRSMGVAGGRVADILDIPVGTTWDQYLAQLGYDPLSTQSGGYSGGYTGGGYTGGGNLPPITEPATEPEENPYKFTNQYHENGKRKTVGYDEQYSKLMQWKKNGKKTDAEIRNEIRRLITNNTITDDEGTMILNALGYISGSTTQRVWGINDQGPVEVSLNG